MKLTRRQTKLLIAALIIFAAAIYGWFKDGNIVVAPNENRAPVQNNSDRSAGKEIAVVTKVLDGDTIIIQGGIHVRLLGIDADEKDYPCYDAARLYLEELILGKSVVLEMDNQNLDQYGRQLRFVFLDGENINQKLVSEGLAIARFYPENQKYKDEIVAAEAEAMKNKIGCKWKG